MAKRRKLKSEPRQKVEFWLRKNKADEVWLVDLIGYLKGQRVFARVIRDGLRLIWDLKNKNVDVLLELFPDVANWLQVKMTPPPPPPDIAKLERQIAQLQQYLIEQGGNQLPQPPADYPSMKPSGLQPLGGMKPIAGGLKPLSKPMVDDDDDVEIVVKKNTSTDAGLNFLAAMASLNAQ